MLRSLAVEDCMQRKPVTVGPEASILKAIHEILANKVSGLCVVEEDRTLVGVLSELDCLKAVLAGVYYQGGSGPVSDFMATEITTAPLDGSIVDIATDMFSRKQRRRPVIVDGKLIGLLTCRQVLRAVQGFSVVHDTSGAGGNE